MTGRYSDRWHKPSHAGTLASYRALPHDQIVCVDTETTGLDPEKDEVLQVSIVDGDGKELLNTLVRPKKRRRWPKAESINGISWSDVKEMPELLELKGDIERIINGASLLVGYNLPFDIDMLSAGGINIRQTEMFDVMREFSFAFGKYNERFGRNQFMKLSNARSHYGIRTNNAHDAFADALSTIQIFHKLINDPDYTGHFSPVPTKGSEKRANRPTEAVRRRVKTETVCSNGHINLDEPKEKEPGSDVGAGCLAFMLAIGITPILMIFVRMIGDLLLSIGNG